MNKTIIFEELNEIFLIFEKLQECEVSGFEYKIKRNVDDYELWIDLFFQRGNFIMRDSVGVMFGNDEQELNIETLVKEAIEEIQVFIDKVKNN